MDRCRRCIIPRGYPRVTFDETGCCSLCRDHEPIRYRGIEALRSDITAMLSRHPRRQYDVVVGLSGGRDSSYLLHVLRRELGLRVLAFFVDHGWIPEEAHGNARRLAEVLDVPLVMHRSHRLQRCFPHQWNAWLRRPRPHTLSTLCMGCKSAIIQCFYKYARRHDTPLLSLGWTPFEEASYKMDLMRADALPGTIAPYAAGYAGEVLRNPALALHPACSATQLLEFWVFFGPYKRWGNRLHHKVEVKPFAEYIRWVEKDVDAILEREYGWRRLPGMTTNWRGDCYLAPVRQHLYRTLLGYDDKTVQLSALIRDGQLTREQALARHDRDGVAEEVLENCCRHLGIRAEAVRAIAR